MNTRQSLVVLQQTSHIWRGTHDHLGTKALLHNLYVIWSRKMVRHLISLTKPIYFAGIKVVFAATENTSTKELLHVHDYIIVNLATLGINDNRQKKSKNS